MKTNLSSPPILLAILLHSAGCCCFDLSSSSSTGQGGADGANSSSSSSSSPAAGSGSSALDISALDKLFAGAPADLRGNIHGNQVRCDRVNDWLAANAKGKTVEIHFDVASISPTRDSTGKYTVLFNLGEKKEATSSVGALSLQALGEAWTAQVTDEANASPYAFGGGLFGGGFFTLTGIESRVAEKLPDLKHATVKGKVKSMVVSPASDLYGVDLKIVLEDVEIEGLRSAK